MPRFHLNDLPKQKRIQMIGEFYDTINSLKNREEVRLFFKDLLTADEIATLMRRVEVAVLLESGFTYDQIADLLGVGRSKINNVQKVLLREGKGSGYKIVIKRLLENRKARLKKQEKIERAQKSSFESLKQRYPGHFLLFNLLDEVSEKLEDSSDLEKEALFYTPSLTSFRGNLPDNLTEKGGNNKKSNKKKTNKNKGGT